jgi:type VI secretion system FHA domain protein
MVRQEASGAGIPEDWDETGYKSSPVPPPASPPSTPQPRSTAAPATGAGFDASQTGTVAQPLMSPSVDDQRGLQDILRAAGVPPESVSPETYAVLGQIFAVVVQGLVDVLKARAHIKDEFRVSATRLKPQENNPLKFSINAQDAMHNLFGRTTPGYQTPVDAFRDSFEDIKAHQMAMIAGMRAAYQKLLEYFDPEGLEAEFDKGLKRGVLGGVLNKTKYWDLYEDLYEHLKKDPDESFHRLFGYEFGRAYEEQMERLSKVRKN